MISELMCKRGEMVLKYCPLPHLTSQDFPGHPGACPLLSIPHSTGAGW